MMLTKVLRLQIFIFCMFNYVIKKNEKNYGLGSTVSKLQSHFEETVYFTTKSPEDHGTHFIDLRRMKG